MWMYKLKKLDSFFWLVKIETKVQHKVSWSLSVFCWLVTLVSRFSDVNDWKSNVFFSLNTFYRQWKTVKGDMAENVTGGPWVCACMKCCMGRRPSMPSHWWRLMGKSWITRYVLLKSNFFLSIFMFVFPELSLVGALNNSISFLFFHPRWHNWKIVGSLPPCGEYVV